MCIVPKKNIEETQLKEFLDTYGGFGFDKISFRPGAIFTSLFGLCNRYKVIDGKVIWDYPGIHKGVDRAGATRVKVGKNYVNDPIYVPFNFGSSGFTDYGGHDYGSIVYMYHKFGFTIRVCHMFPDDILIKDNLMKGYALKSKEVIGPAGTYGFSTGNHTHVEVEAWGFNGEWLVKCDMLEVLLEEKYGVKVFEQFTKDEVVNIYKDCPETNSWNGDKCLKDFKQIKKDKNIDFINRYKIVYKLKGGLTTYYSSAYLFSM